MNIYNQISSNKRKTWLIMFLFVLFITTVGYIFGKVYESGAFFAGIAFIFASLTAVFSYFSGSNAVLALSGAKQISEKDNPHLYHIVENLCIGTGMPMPKIYIMNDPSPNAFATGRDPKHGVICFTTGILEILNKSELEGVTAHELSHIKNLDIRLMAVVTVLVGFVAILSEFFLRSLWFKSDDNRAQGVFVIIGIVLALLSPLVATLIQLSVSRKREFLADASGALLTRYPDGLASALEKLAHDKKPLHNATNATAHLFIENPFQHKDTKHWFTNLFNTHPPMEERIKILRSM